MPGTRSGTDETGGQDVDPGPRVETGTSVTPSGAVTLIRGGVTASRTGRAPAPSQAPAVGAAPRPPAAASDLDAIVRELNDVFRAGAVDLHLRLGRVVIERLYRGDLRRWRARGPRDISFRKLAARAGADLAVSATGLCRAVAVCELVDRLGVSSWKHLTVSHLRGVLGLSDADQRQLLASAEASRWTVEQLEREAARLRAQAEERRGRRPLPAFVKTLHRFARLVAEPQETFAGIEKLSEITDETVGQLLETVSRVREQLDMLESRVASQRPGCKASPGRLGPRHSANEGR